MTFYWIILFNLLTLCITMVCQNKTGLDLSTIGPVHDLGEHISTIVNRNDQNYKHMKLGHGINRSNLVTISPIEPIIRSRPNIRDVSNNNTCTGSNLIHIPTSPTDKNSNHKCNLAVLNAQSVCNKANEIFDFIIEENPDYFAHHRDMDKRPRFVRLRPTNPQWLHNKSDPSKYKTRRWNRHYKPMFLLPKDIQNCPFLNLRINL